MGSCRPRAVTLVIVIVIMVATSLSACSSHDDSSRTLTLYSGQDEATTALLVDAFEHQTGIRVKVRSDDEALLANDLAQTGKRDSADVFYSENTPALRLLELHKLLAPVARTTLAKADSRWQSTSGDWVGVSARVYVMDYNTDKLGPDALPTSAMDLGSSGWKGRIGIAPRDTDFQSVVTSILRTHGEERTLDWLDAIKTNAGSYVYSDNSVLADAINRGQVELGLINQHSWFRERAKVGAWHMSSAVAFLRPHDAGYHLDISGAAVLRSSHAPAAAQRLVAFLASRGAAEIIARSKSYEYPLAANVKAATDLTDFNSLSPVPLTFNDLGDGTRAIELLRQANLL
jgi:iron(III) transport system substrate-binding protein